MMKKALFWQTVVLLAPVVLLLLWGGRELWRLFGFQGGVSLPETSWLGLFPIVAGLLAVIEVIRLAQRTIRGKKYQVGGYFVCAVFGAGIAASYLEQVFGLAFAVVVAAPPVILAARLLRAQHDI